VTRAHVAPDPATCHPLAHAYLSHVVGEMVGIPGVWDFVTPEDLELYGAERPEGESHVESPRDFRRKVLQEIWVVKPYAPKSVEH